MKSSFSFKIAGVKIPELGTEIGEFSVEAEVEYTPAEFLELTRQAGEFYEWLGEKIEPLVSLGMAQVMAKMERETVAEEAAAREYADADGGPWQVYCREDADADGGSGKFVRATSRTFKTESEARHYARGINPNREPFVTTAP